EQRLAGPGTLGMQIGVAALETQPSPGHACLQLDASGRAVVDVAVGVNVDPARVPDDVRLDEVLEAVVEELPLQVQPIARPLRTDRRIARRLGLEVRIA